MLFLRESLGMLSRFGGFRRIRLFSPHTIIEATLSFAVSVFAWNLRIGPLVSGVKQNERKDTHIAECHLEQTRGSEATEGASKDPEDVRTPMLIQGVSAMDCPGTRTFWPQFSARLCCGSQDKLPTFAIETVAVTARVAQPFP